MLENRDFGMNAYCNDGKCNEKNNRMATSMCMCCSSARRHVKLCLGIRVRETIW